MKSSVEHEARNNTNETREVHSVQDLEKQDNVSVPLQALESSSDLEGKIAEDVNIGRARSSWGILNDKYTDEVPGSVLLIPRSTHNIPLGLRNQPARTSSSSLPSPFPQQSRPVSIKSAGKEKKRTGDGKIILDPQPDDSPNDPLNWPAWRRDCALLSLGFYCMLGGGMTPILAAGYDNIASTYDVSESNVALTTGLYMTGLGIGSVIWSPTAILFGKRPVYLFGAIIFIISCIWCAVSPSFTSLLVARIFQGLAVSPVECLPSATIAEIFFLHERAFRLGIYTLLLLGGKNLIPLISAAIIQGLGWRWIFWIFAIVAGAGFVLLFLFVPETFWDRTPHAHHKRQKQHTHRPFSDFFHRTLRSNTSAPASVSPRFAGVDTRRVHKERHVEFDEDGDVNLDRRPSREVEVEVEPRVSAVREDGQVGAQASLTPKQLEEAGSSNVVEFQKYTANLRTQPAKSFFQTLKFWNGRLHSDNWFKVAFRPFILFAYPSVLWSTLVYSLSVGWLIVMSEAMSSIFKNKDTYNFSSLGTGLLYISPFVGGIFGTAVAGRISDIIVRFMTRRNDGLYEPEFRLVMALPVLVTTVVGLMGFGWSAQERDMWIVPTLFFGIISFGCCVGSTTAITFCVDSYRQYAGEALVTLNFSKNIFHGLVFSLFFVNWLEADGARTTFLAIGSIQIVCLLTTVPMYIYGKRARMWTVRMNLMEKF